MRSCRGPTPQPWKLTQGAVGETEAPAAGAGEGGQGGSGEADAVEGGGFLRQAGDVDFTLMATGNHRRE